MMRRVVTIAGWGLLVLLPLTGIVLAWTSLTFTHRMGILESGDSLTMLRLWLQDLTPALLTLFLGLALGGACLLLASIDKRLEKLERR